jgi:O-antigen/teichoic acid export membrane protein
MIMRDDSVSIRMGGIIRQSSALFVGNIVLIIGGYAFKIFLASTVGAEGLGLFALGETLMGFALLLTLWSLDETVFRFIPQFSTLQATARLQRLLWASTFHVLAFSLLAAALLFLTRQFWAGSVFHNNALSGALCFFALMLPARALSTLFRQMARGFKEVKWIVISQSLIAFPCKVVLSLILISLGWGLSGWLLGEAFSYIISTAMLGWLAWNLTPSAARPPVAEIRHEPAVYAFTGTMVGLSFLGVTINSLAPFLLGIYLGASDVGVYSVALTMVGIMTMVQSNINSVFAPHIPELYASGNTSELVEIYYRVTRTNLAATFPLFVMYLLLADQIMAVFGSEFAKGSLVLMILALGGLIDLGAGPVATLLKLTGHERFLFLGDLFKIVSTSATLLLLLPVFGLVGAAIAWSITTTGFFLFMYFYAKRIFPIYFYNHTTLKLFTSGGSFLLLGWVLLNFLKPYFAPLPLLIIAFIVLYMIWSSWVYWGLMDATDKKFAGAALPDFLRRRCGFCVTPKES